MGVYTLICLIPPLAHQNLGVHKLMDYWAAALCPSLYKHLPLHTITCSTVTIENCAIDYVLIHLPIIFSHCKM